MPKKFPLLRRSSGLNVAVDPTRIDYNPETGITDLQAAVNVELDRTGWISRRKGFSSCLSGSTHSIFSAGNYAIAAWNYLTQHYLIWLQSDGSSGTMVELEHYNDRLCYARIGSRVYYSNGTEKGFIEERTAYSWSAGTVSSKDSTRTFSDPPAGHLMTITKGRMWIAKDNAIFFSEPLAYNLFDYARGWVQLTSSATLLRGVADGIYVSDASGIYFWNGSNPREMSPFQVSSSPAILGTDVLDLVSGVSLGLQDSYLYLIFMTTKGICAAGPSGRFFNLTEEKLSYPAVTQGSSVLKKNNNILFLLNG